MKTIRFFAMLFLSFNVLLGQNVPDSKIFSNHLPPSPNASSIDKFLTSDVDMYTGKGNINIPIFNFKSGDISIPISLSYNTKGVKVSDEASWVGLGWSLNCGGVISRVINGKDDFHTRGYVFGDELPETGNGQFLDYDYAFRFDSPEDIAKLEMYAMGTADAQPDDFYFSFQGYSGELFFEKNSSKACLVDQSSNLQFNYNFETQSWEAIDNSGWKYYFEKSEISRNISQTSNSPVPYPSGTYSEESITAWYLTRIQTPKGDHVNLEYKETGNYIESTIDLMELSEFGPYINFNLNQRKGLVISNLKVDYNTSTVNQVREVYIDKIIGNEGEVVFTSNNRLDRKNVSSADPAQYLQDIKIYSANGILFKKYTFTYSYFNYNYLNHNEKEKFLRLKLLSLQEFGWIDEHLESIRPYVFHYNNIELPAKNSFSTDLWGYFNNSNSTIKNYHHIQLGNIFNGLTIINQHQTNNINTKIPRNLYFGDTSNDFTHIFVNGANKSVNPDVIEASILNKIDYPTGGITKLIYEPNSYSGVDLKCDSEESFNLSSNGISSKDFLVQEPGAFLLLQLDMHLYIPYVDGIYENMEAAVFVKNQQGQWIKFIEFLPESGPVNELFSNICVLLDEGEYRLVTSSGTISQMAINVNATLLSQVHCPNINADGLRVKEINYYDNDNKLANKQSYNYSFNGKSSGVKMSSQEFLINEYDIFHSLPFPNRHPCCFIGSLMYPAGCHSFIKTGSVSFSNVSHAAKGNHIGYSQVQKQDMDNMDQNNGYSMFYFENEPIFIFPVNLPYYPGIRNLHNGELKMEIQFNTNNDTILKKTYKYNTAVEASKSVLGLISLTTVHPACGLPPLPFVAIGQAYYKKSEWRFLEKVIEKSFSVNGQEAVSTEISFVYNNFNKLITEILKSYKEGIEQHQLLDRIKYVDDYSTSFQFVNDLKNNNIINRKIKIEKIIDGYLVNGNIFSYSDFGETKLEYIYENPLLTTPELHSPNIFLQQNYKLQREFFYSTGNYSSVNQLVSVTELGLSTNSIDWGYNHSKPICFTKNCSSKESSTNSFENYEANGWILNQQSIISWDPFNTHTGEYYLYGGCQRSFPVGDEALKHEGYTASVWVKGSSQAFIRIEQTGNPSSTLEVSNTGAPGEWNLIEVKIPKAKYIINGSLILKVTIGGDANALWDDIRFHPSDASMTTYTYAPLIGMTSQSDANNLPTYYEYDPFGRLKLIRDHKKNILKTFEYNYAH